MSDNDFKVYRINDCDWYLGRTLDEAVKAAMRDYGIPRDEACDDHARPLTDDELRDFVFHDDDGSRRTFAKEFQRRLAAGAKPEMFASTEY